VEDGVKITGSQHCGTGNATKATLKDEHPSVPGSGRACLGVDIVSASPYDAAGAGEILHNLLDSLQNQ
jgi:hypothetical protein